MNLWLLACLVTCFVGTWAPAVQAQGVEMALVPIHFEVLGPFPSYVLQALSNSCQMPPYQGPKVSRMASLSPGLSLGFHRAWDCHGDFEDCCLAYNTHVSLRVLRRAQSYWCLDVSRSCNLPAVIFHFPHRKLNVCGNPQAKWVQDGIRLLNTRNKGLLKHHQRIQRASQRCPTVGKLSPKTSSVPLSAPRGHTRSIKKNALPPAQANSGP